jgi:hypothetical protein
MSELRRQRQGSQSERKYQASAASQPEPTRWLHSSRDPADQLSLEHVLKLVLLYSECEPIKFERAALRWLARYVTDGKAVSLLKAQLAVSALAELRSRRARGRSEDAHGVGAARAVTG